MDRSRLDPPRPSPAQLFRTVRVFGAPALLGWVIGCSPLGPSGCDTEPPRATDAAAGSVMILEDEPPCTYSSQGVRGSKGRLLATIVCPGTSDPFLVAVRMSGRLPVLVEAQGAGFGSEVQIDAGAWDAPDSLWHDVELIVDPLNLFKETDEGNNRSVSRVRVVGPDLALNGPLTRISDTNGNDVSTASVGQPLRVIASARVGGWYQSAELSARCAAFNFTQTVDIGSCDRLVNGPPLVHWDWTPSTPGSYSVEFRIKAASGESDSDSTNNVTFRPLTVVAGPPRPTAR